MRAFFGLLALLFGAVLCAPAEGRTVRGTVTKVVDGDTVRVKTGSRTQTFDLHGVRAPAGGACYARQARSALRRLVNRRSVRVKIVRGRSAEILRGSQNVNRAMVAGGHARAKAGKGKLGVRLRADENRARARGRGLHGACAVPEGSAPQSSPGAGDMTGQPAIAELTANLTGMAFSRSSSSSGSTTRTELHLCPGGAFRYWSQESLSSDGAFLNLRNESLGRPWSVTEALVKADGSRAAIIRGAVVSQASGDGPQAVSDPQAAVRVDFANGQWYVDGQPVLAYPGEASCTPLLRHG